MPTQTRNNHTMKEDKIKEEKLKEDHIDEVADRIRKEKVIAFGKKYGMNLTKYALEGTDPFRKKRDGDLAAPIPTVKGGGDDFPSGAAETIFSKRKRKVAPTA